MLRIIGFVGVDPVSFNVHGNFGLVCAFFFVVGNFLVFICLVGFDLYDIELISIQCLGVCALGLLSRKFRFRFILVFIVLVCRDLYSLILRDRCVWLG